MNLATLLTPANIATAIIALNFIAFAAFEIDKAQAESGGWRVSEATLLQLALIGGTAGAYVARAVSAQDQEAAVLGAASHHRHAPDRRHRRAGGMAHLGARFPTRGSRA